MAPRTPDVITTVAPFAIVILLAPEIVLKAGVAKLIVNVPLTVNGVAVILAEAAEEPPSDKIRLA